MSWQKIVFNIKANMVNDQSIIKVKPPDSSSCYTFRIIIAYRNLSSRYSKSYALLLFIVWEKII